MRTNRTAKVEANCTQRPIVEGQDGTPDRISKGFVILNADGTNQTVNWLDVGHP